MMDTSTCERPNAAFGYAILSVSGTCDWTGSMHADEVRHLGALAGRVFGAVTRRGQELHIGVADRVFQSVGAAAMPVRVVHDRVANASYRAVSVALAGAGRLGGELAGGTASFGEGRPPAPPNSRV